MNLTRRQFSLGSAALLTGCASTLKQCQQQIQNRPTRRNVAGMATNDPMLLAFRSAIQQMKALPSSDPRNWTNQASIHNNFCPHGNWLLLPWHRAYLYYFEKICQKLSGMSDFALPYWDWSTSPSLPAVYFDSTSPLYDSTRFITPTSVADSGSTGPPVLDGILNEPDFLIFGSGKIAASDGQRTRATSGPLEATPHNYIHGFVGGDMGAFMSPLDPVFWAHHGMIDRCWVDWNIVRNHSNTSDSDWTNRKFTEFCDENGAPVQVDVITTVLMPIFSYQYDAPIGGTAPQALFVGDERQWQAEKETQVKPGAKITLETLHDLAVQAGPVDLGRPSTVAFTAPVAAPAAGERTLLALEGTSMNHTDDFFVRVFANKPDADVSTPVTDPHLIATFSFFNHDHGQGPEPGAFVFDATSALGRVGTGAAPPALTFVLVPFAGHQPATRSFSPGVVHLRSVRETIGKP
jgi:tyrosinase